MRITTWNVNGLRAAIRKGFEQMVHEVNPDVLLLQEVRALPEQLPEEWASPPDWHVLWHPAERKGYSGTAVLSRHPIREVGRGIGQPDLEGRLLHVRVKRIDLVCAYLPSGSSGDHRQEIKDQWMHQFLPWAEQLLSKRQSVIIGGDLNIAHTEQDIFHAKSNAQTSGFLPHEREWFSRLLETGWHDLVREHFGDRDGPYSWWSNRGQARELDRGWRIDYLLGNRAARRRFRSAEILRRGGLEVSDHAPVTIELK